MFGESGWDKRDFTMGLAGLVAGLHALRILAEQGLASLGDISVAEAGLKSVLAQLPDGAVDPVQLQRLHDLIGGIGAAAAAAEIRKERP